MSTTALTTILTVLLAMIVYAPSAEATFGLKNLDVTFTNQDGSPAMLAGSHPFAATFKLDAVTEELGGGEVVPVGAIKTIKIEQPSGFVGDPGAAPTCSPVLFLESAADASIHCPNETVLGKTTVTLGTAAEGIFSTSSPVYNLDPPPGAILKLGFIVEPGVPVTLEVGLSPTYPYNPVVSVSNVSQAVQFYGSTTTIWGDPESSVHDSERGPCLKTAEADTCPVSGIAERPFITLSRNCAGPLATMFEADSWQDPSVWFKAPAVLSHDGSEPSVPLALSGCGELSFAPRLSAAPTTDRAESPSGLDVEMNVNDEGIGNPAGRAQSDMKKMIVTLPEGMTANPSLAEGLAVCSETGFSAERVDSEPGEGCPQASKIGTVEAESPLLQGTVLKGQLFIAKPHQNPFGTLLGLYLVIRDRERGVFVGLPGKIEPDLQTGRLITTFGGAPYEIPQFPVSHLSVQLREGARSPLATPPGCGAYSVKTEMIPWSGGAPVLTTSAFQIIAGPNETPCPTAGGAPPFAPVALAGTQNNSAGSYSTFYLRIGRKDGEQELTRFTTNLPAGLTGNLSGIPFCPDIAIETARTKTGIQETNQPSCSAASEIGHTVVGAGVGGVPAYAPGKVYLAGPYHGSALSVVSITSATVGPFDLGTVVIRFALRINPTTAQVEIDSTGSDPIPHIIQGIVVHVRDIHVYIDRQSFILNPTNCDPLSINNTITGTGANIANPVDDISVTTSNRFQAADCSNLAFKPSFKVTTSGKTSRKNGASLNVKLTYPKTPQGTQTNIRSVKVNLPKQLPSRLTTLQQACTDAQFQTNPAGCPVASRVGQATAVTPILPVPIVGPVYFVSHGGAKFPELILVLQGYGVTIDLHGETFISKAGITSSTFRTVPDQPVTSFELTLSQGPNSALAANGNLCTSTLKMPTQFTGQNGAVIKQTTPITATGCPKKKTKHKARKASKASHHHRTNNPAGKK